MNNEQTDNLTTEHSYQLLGFVPGVINHLTLTVSNKDKEVIATRTIDIDMSSIESKAATKLETTDGSSTEELSNGLYTLLGLDKTFNANTYLYDNNGILRGELVLNSYRSDRIIFIGSDMLYSYSKTGIARVNRLGKVVKKYTTTGYYMHHDYVYDEDNNNLLILANKNEASTIEDRVISINLETSQVKEVVDMKELLGNMYKTATPPKGGNTYGGNELDWIHLNSLQVVNGQDIVLSSRELSTIIYVENAYASPKIKYLISDESMYKDTTYKNLLLTKEGTFASNAGQHTITYTTSSDLADGQYYLEMYNNNYGAARTRPDFSWDSYEGVGTYSEGDKSLYYKYLVDENNGTYKLVDKVELPYSSIVSSVQKIDGNLMTSSGMSNLYDEYDSNNELIREFKYSAKKYAYRVFKYKYSNLFVD